MGFKVEDNSNIKEKLRSLLVQLHDWEKTNTNVPGVKIIKIPSKNEIPERLGIEINPVDASGRLIKKTGQIVLTNEELFTKYVELLNHPKIQELMHEIEFLRQEMQEQTQDKSGVIFEL